MSLFHTENLGCPACGSVAPREIAGSVAATRRPDLRDEILNDTFQRFDCVACGKSFRVNPTLTYMDVARGTWILTLPCADRPHWDAFESGALSMFDDSFGPEAPAAARSLGERLKVRVTFGWSGLREKLLCEVHGIDDAQLELLKLLLWRTTESGRLRETASLRLIDRGAGGELVMAWLSDADESGSEVVTVPSSLLADIAADPGWHSARAALSGGPFVDAAKLLVEPELAVPD